MSGLVALGKAYELQFRRDGLSTIETVKFPGWWWAWDGSADRGHILLVKPTTIIAAPRGTSKAMHATFHGNEPDKGFDVKAPIVGDCRRAGLVISFAYDARSFSSSKRTMPYRHHFGAETHEDRPPFDEKYWPILAVADDGGLMIKRRAGNVFRLEDWVVG